MGLRRWFGHLKIMKTLTKSELETEFGQERIQELCGGVAGIRGAMRVECREPSVEGQAQKPILDFIGSDDSLDRYDETIVASGWRLDNYQKNPVFQNSHKYGDVIFTLGKALETKVVNNALVQRIEFATEVNPMAKLAYGLYRGGFLNAVSVGFIPLKWENGTEASKRANGTGYRRKYLEQELLELSAVAVPANPNELLLGLRAGAVSSDDVLAVMDMVDHYVDALSKASPMEQLIKEFCGSQVRSDANAGASCVGPHQAQLLQIAKTANWVLQRA
jgi:hypothetical protein